MAGWDEGYVSDVGYTMGYYGDMNPLRMRLALLNAGWHAPTMATACESEVVMRLPSWPRI